MAAGSFLTGGKLNENEHTMNDIIRAMEERRSIRSFKPEMPPKEDIEQIIKAGLYAPSGRGEQATIILAVTNKKIRDMMSESNRLIAGMKKGTDPFHGAPVILIVLGDKDHPTYLYDGSLVMGNMLLAAHSLGLGSIWVHRAKEEFWLPEYKFILEKLGIEGEWEGIGHCAVGYIDGDIPSPAPRKKNRVYWLE